MKKTLIIAFIMILPIVYSQTIPLETNLSLVNATCYDGRQNQNETGVDCGGPCPACPSCFDGVQNQGETGIDCGGPCTACKTDDSGGSSGESGSSGGGIAAGPVLEKIFLIKENQTITLLNNLTSVYRVDITVNRDVRNFSGMIEYVNSMPLETRDINYEYNKISASGLNTSYIKEVDIWFKVDKIFIDSVGGPIDSIILYQHKGRWHPLQTIFVDEDESYYLFYSKSDSLGFFSVSVREVKFEEGDTKENELPELEQPIKSNWEKTQILMFYGGITALVSAIIVFAYTHKESINLPNIFPMRFTDKREKMKMKLGKYKEKMDDIDERLRNL